MAVQAFDSPSGIGLGQRDPWTVKHIRPFDKWPDNASEQERLWAGRVARLPSFNYEFGSRLGRELSDDPKLEDEDKFVEYFKACLYGKHYKCYVCDSKDQQEPIVVLIQGKEKAPPGPTVAKKLQSRKVMIISKKDDERLLIPLMAGKVRIKDMLKQLRPDLQGADFRQIIDDTIDEDLLDFMTKQIITNYKFGVLYQRAGQTEEDQWYNNVDGGSELEEFLTFLGERITLNGFTKFRGGLSVTGTAHALCDADPVADEKTGTHSIYATLAGLEIMFHVSTYIPYYPNDPQQVERKRHLGNDVVVIIFRESDCQEPFDPMKIKSQFNHTFCVVQPSRNKESGVTHYSIGFVSRDSGVPYGPLLPVTASFPRTEKLRKWLLTKLINAERAAMYSPEFKERLWKARKMILQDLISRHAGTSHHTRVGAATATTVGAVGGGLKMMLTAPVTVPRAVIGLAHTDKSVPAPPMSVRSPREKDSKEKDPKESRDKDKDKDKDKAIHETDVPGLPMLAESANLLSTSFGSPKRGEGPRSGKGLMLSQGAGEEKDKQDKAERRDTDHKRREKEKEKEKEKEREKEKEKEREAQKEKEAQQTRELAMKEKERAMALAQAAQKEKETKEREAKEREAREAKEREKEAREREAREKEARDRETREREARALQHSSSPVKASLIKASSIAPEDRPMFMEEDEGFSPPAKNLSKKALKEAEQKKKPR